MTGHQCPLLLIDPLTAAMVALGYGLLGINGAAAGASLEMVGGAVATASLRSADWASGR